MRQHLPENTLIECSEQQWVLKHIFCEFHTELVCDSMPNFWIVQTEPTVLPAKIPNILVNGSSGIAVGMATNMPPHNLSEVINALNLLIDNPDVAIEDLLVAMPGPDFPTGTFSLHDIASFRDIMNLLSSNNQLRLS